MIPMLARPIEGDPDHYIRDPEWALDLKVNGRRLVANGTMGKLRFFNRRGERTDGPRTIVKELETLVTLNAVLDGEYVGNEYWVFDMPACATMVTPATPWDERRAALEALFDPHIWNPHYVKLLPTARTTARKRSMMKRIWNSGHEGAVLKRVSAPYEPGARSGSWLKAKHVRTIDTVVMSFGTDKDNLQFGVYRDGELVEIGECSRLEGDAPRVDVGDVLEVAVLNVGSPDKPRAYQPHAKRRRDPAEKQPSECTWDQIDGLWIQKGVLV